MLGWIELVIKSANYSMYYIDVERLLVGHSK